MRCAGAVGMLAGALMARRTGVPFARLCELSGLPRPVAEFRFNATRKWRFDWAWPHGRHGARVALEVQGGLFIAGRHSRGAALLKEHEKLNEAAADGWRILYVTPQTLESATTFDLIRRALG
jgi:hypothetical protein